MDVSDPNDHMWSKPIFFDDEEFKKVATKLPLGPLFEQDYEDMRGRKSVDLSTRSERFQCEMKELKNFVEREEPEIQLDKPEEVIKRTIMSMGKKLLQKKIEALELVGLLMPSIGLVSTEKQLHKLLSRRMSKVIIYTVLRNSYFFLKFHILKIIFLFSDDLRARRVSRETNDFVRRR